MILKNIVQFKIAKYNYKLMNINNKLRLNLSIIKLSFWMKFKS